MTEYKVVWTIDVEANSPQEAAQEALDIQLDNEQASFFEVEQDGIIVAEVDLFEGTVKLFGGDELKTYLPRRG